MAPAQAEAVQRTDYLPVRQQEIENVYETHVAEKSPRTCPKSHLACWSPVIIHLILFAAWTLGTLWVVYQRPGEKACTAKLSTHFISYVQKQFDGEIEQDNKYRGKPTPEIDAEWLRIGLDTPGLRLTEEDPKKLNKSDAPDRPLHRIPDEFGGGYLAMLEVFHLLHCLDSLRQAIYKDYYTEDIKKASKSGWRVHTDHCIDILRETIMCTADVTPVTFYDAKLMPARKLPMPDCSTLHTCRNFDDILRWNAGNERTLQ